jgi:hypothetical protein
MRTADIMAWAPSRNLTKIRGVVAVGYRVQVASAKIINYILLPYNMNIKAYNCHRTILITVQQK